MSKQIRYDLYTMCLLKKDDKVLLIERPDHRGFPGCLGPGGKVDFPESPAEGAVREVLEETGLHVKRLMYKGLDEYVVPQTNYRYMVFNYISDDFEGELLTNPPEGKLLWVPIQEALELPMQPWFRRRFPMYFQEGTFEISVVWDEENKCALEDKVKQL